MAETRILVVEDEAIVAEDIRRTLKNMGYAVPSTASSGEEALKKIEETNPDIVLMDIVLCGEIDGVETARQVSSRFNTPVIYLTAHSDKATLERAKITGPFGYIIKPFKEKELKMAIEIALFKHEAEEALRRSEERYRNLVENAKDVIFTLSTEGLITSINPSFETVTGWLRSDWLGKNFLGIIHPGDLPLAMELFHHTLNGEVSPSSLELRVLSKSGVFVSMDFVVTPQVVDGKVVNILGISRDVTERKRAEDELKVSEEKYRTLIENIQDGVFIIQDARIQFVNEAFARMIGYTVEEITGKEFQEVVAPEDLKMVAERYNRRQKGENVPKEYEFRMLRRDGTIILVNMNVGLISYHGRIASMGTVKDITERKKSEEALRESEDRYRRLVDFSTFGIAIHCGHKIVYVNPAAMKIFGATKPEELIGKPILQFIHPAYHEIVEERIRKQKYGEIAPLIEEKFLRLDGTSVDVEIVSIPFTYKGKQAMYGIFQDITERKRAEERYKTIIRTAMDGFWIADTQGHILDVNDAYCSLIGYRRDELLTMCIQDIEAKEKPEETAQHIRKIMEVGSGRFETRHKCKDGKIVDIEISVNYSKDEDQLFVFIRDITERKRTEEALRLKEERFRLLIENASDIITILNADGTIIYESPSIERVLGYGTYELIGRALYEFVHPDDLIKVMGTINNIAQVPGITQSAEFRCKHKDGSWHIIEFVGKSVLIETGANELIINSRDITMRKMAEEALSWEAGVSEAIANLSTTLISQATIEDISSFVLELTTFLTNSKFGFVGFIDPETGYLIASRMSSDVWELCQVDNKKTIFKKLKGLFGWMLTNQKPIMINTLENDPRSSGTPKGHITIHRFLSAPALIGETPVGLIALANSDREYTKQDLALVERLATIYAIALQHKMTEEALERSDKFSRTILNSMNDELCIIDVHDFRIVGVNSVFLRELGLKEEDVIGKHCYEITHQRSDPCELEGEICPLLETVKTGKHSSVEHLHYKESGKKIYVEVSTSPIMDEKGELIQVVHVSRDITERKLAEERLKQANIELIRANKLKTQFLSVVSHELRTPITPMNAQLQMILAGFFGEVTEKQKTSLDMILRNTRRLDRLIGDVLDISKLESGVMKFNMAKADLNEIVENAVEIMKIQALDKNQKLTIKEDKTPQVTVDKDRITQVIVNLLNNAIKFTDAGGTIELELSGNTDHARVAVRDNGIGIKKDDQERLFTPFQQVDSSESRKYEGSGLGLAICKKIITYHGGNIGVESEPGKGSTFYFTIPYNYQMKKEKVDSSLFEKIMLNEV